jgi:glycosyltransferase involved in cell wall biosynthesis
LGVDFDIFNPQAKPLLPDNNKFRILNIGKIELRKYHDGIPHVIKEAFPTKSDIELVMSFNNAFLSEAEHKEWQNLYKDILGERVTFVPFLQTEQEMAGLIRSCHVGFFPSKSEGWGLALQECLSCGLHCIATCYAGHTELINRYNCRLIHIERLEDCFDPKWFPVGTPGQWAAIGDNQILEIVTHLRSLYPLWKDKKLKYPHPGYTTAQSFNWNSTAEIIIDLLK